MVMKNVITLMLLGIFAGSATASSPQELKARLATKRSTEQLLPPIDSRCNIDVGNQHIDYGNMTRYQLQNVPDSSTALTPGERTLSLSASCPSARAIAFTLLGPRGADGKLRYGTQGALLVRMDDAAVDGKKVQLLVQNRQGQSAPLLPEDSIQLNPGQKIVAMREGKVVQGNILTARLTLLPVLPSSSTQVATQTTSEGRFTLLMEEMADR